MTVGSSCVFNRPLPTFDPKTFQWGAEIKDCGYNLVCSSNNRCINPVTLRFSCKDPRECSLSTTCSNNKCLGKLKIQSKFIQAYS